MSARDLPLLELLAQAAGVTATIDRQARVEPGALVGEGCHIKSGAVVARGTRLGRSVQVGANVVFIEAEGAEAASQVDDEAVIGANAVVHANLRIGAAARVMPGAVVTRSVPDGAVVAGNPAQIIETMQPQGGVSLHALKGDVAGEVPFVPQRCAIITGDQPWDEGAQRGSRQFLVCLRGRCTVQVDDGQQRVEIELTGPERGLHLPAMTWSTLQRHSADTTLLVFGSQASNPIGRYDEFIAELGQPA